MLLCSINKIPVLFCTGVDSSLFFSLFRLFSLSAFPSSGGKWLWWYLEKERLNKSLKSSRDVVCHNNAPSILSRSWRPKLRQGIWLIISLMWWEIEMVELTSIADAWRLLIGCSVKQIFPLFTERQSGRWPADTKGKGHVSSALKTCQRVKLTHQTRPGLPPKQIGLPC